GTRRRLSAKARPAHDLHGPCDPRGLGARRGVRGRHAGGHRDGTGSATSHHRTSDGQRDTKRARGVFSRRNRRKPRSSVTAASGLVESRAMTNFDSTAGSPGQVRFFNPGPVWVRPQVLQALTGPMLSHRSQAFMDLYGRILEKLPKVFRTARTAHTLATSATGVWESALVSCVEGPVLSLGNGAFSEKWSEMSQRLGLETDLLKVEWGKPISPDDVKKKLAGKKYAAVTVVHSETS